VAINKNTKYFLKIFQLFIRTFLAKTH